jgi:hypothetical protein
MSIIKNVSGPYIINTINHDDPIILDSNVVIVKGNLQIIGNTTTITSNNTVIQDNFIVLNRGEEGNGVTLGLAGIQIDRGTNVDVDIRYVEATNRWEITNDGSTYYAIVATSTGNTRLVDDPSPMMSGNLNTNSQIIVNEFTANIVIDPLDVVEIWGNLAIYKNVNQAIPNIVPHHCVISTSNVGTGGTGIYVTNDEGTINQELISKSKAVVYSIIF